MKNSRLRRPGSLTRRDFLRSGAVGSAAALLPNHAGAAEAQESSLPAAFSSLKPLGSRIHPIATEEYLARQAHARQLMSEANPKFDVLFVAPGTALYYFTGIHWWASERLLGFFLPRSGEPFFVCPAFEEGRLHEQLHFPAEVRVWQEDQSPSKLAATILAGRGLRTARIGVEEFAQFTFFDHLRHAAPSCAYASADPVTIGCRGVKSAHEQELIRLACQATFDVFRAVFASLKEGMAQSEVAAMVERAFGTMNLRGDALVLFGASAALPHGSIKPQALREGDVVLIDGGCKVEGYNSDVTRTGVFGKPSQKVRSAYEIVRNAQDATLDAARRGRLSGTVDDAARAVITGAGYGPDYKYFTHRVGHGLGLDGHEHPYLVRGSKTALEPGMVFSNEPGIYIPGEFGMRCEDDMVIAADGPARLLTANFQPSLEKPLG